MHAFEKIQRIRDVVSIVKKRLSDGLSYIQGPSEVHDSVKLVFAKDRVNSLDLSEIGYDKSTTPINGLAMAAILQVVKDDDTVASSEKFSGTMTTNVASTTRYKQFHGQRTYSLGSSSAGYDNKQVSPM